MQKVTLKYVNGIWFEIFFTVLICIALLIFTFDFINRENFIYFWDYSGYWVRYQGLMDSFSKFSLDAIGRVLSSVRYKEYNLLPVSLLLPSGMVLGESRMAYVIGNTIVFTFPFVILFAYFFERRINAESKFNNSRIAFTIALLCLAFSPQLWVPVLCGYLGAGGLILAVVVLLNYFCKPFNEQSYSSILFMALLLCVMVIFRRWYAYWVGGFLLSITIVQIGRASCRERV